MESVSRKILELAPVLGVVALCLGSVSHWIPELELVLGIVFLWCPILGVALAAVLGFVFLAPADLGVVLGVALLRIQKT